MVEIHKKDTIALDKHTECNTDVTPRAVRQIHSSSVSSDGFPNENEESKFHYWLPEVPQVRYRFHQALNHLVS